jgi:hypothetical protein
VENRHQCQVYQSAVISGAEWYVSSPSIHLRYYLEEWLDALLAWVKFFFMPGLDYGRYEPLSGYNEWSEVFAEQSEVHGRDRAKRSAFDHLLERFEAEADRWSADIATM